MSESIANQENVVTTETAKKVLGCTAEAERRLLDEGLDFIVFQKIIDDPHFRNNLVAYANAGAPEIELWKCKIWKTIKLGTGLKTADDFCQDLDNKGFKISEWAKDILGKLAFTTAAQETELDLVKVTVAELGFKNRARRDQIYAKAKELGLELCLSEVGPQLRLQYQDQPNGEWVLIGMEPIPDSVGGLGVFCVGGGGSVLWLRGRCGRAGGFWPPGPLWVFVRPRK